MRRAMPRRGEPLRNARLSDHRALRCGRSRTGHRGDTADHRARGDAGLRQRVAHAQPEKARVSQGLVVIPTDSATDDQIRRYRDYAARRFERTKTPQGARGMLFSPDYVGPSDELADQL